MDQQLHIEKPIRSLIAFDKVEVKAGQSETVTLSFAKEDMAFCSYLHDNGDGTKGCYFLEKDELLAVLCVI